MPITWPRDILMPRTILFDPMHRTRSGGASLSGVEQVVSSGAGIWKATLASIPISTQDQREIVRSLNVQSQGRLGEWLVPVYAREPRVFPHGSVSVTVAAASLGATTLSITVSPSYVEGFPQHFSINHDAAGKRLYRVVTKTQTGAGAWNVVVWPPLREALVASRAVEVDYPQCAMRLSSDDELDLQLNMHRFGSISVSFVELPF